MRSMQLSKPMIALLERHNITTPTPIQREIIPAILEGRDVLAQSETGSGKTLSFAVPLIETITKRDGLAALVLVPTRELCVQVSGEFVKFSEGKHLGITSVYGGVSINEQIRKMRTTNIVVATPGRLIDLLNRRALTLDTIRYLVLDEADRMLDMGFIQDMEKILQHIPQQRQTLLFSATISKEIDQLSRKYLQTPVNVKLESSVKPEFLQQTYYRTTAEQKLSLLIHLLKKERDLTLVFCNRKHIASKIARRLTANGVQARSLHGDLSQAQRERVTEEFRKRRLRVLVATDVAARGLHIEGISHVYNYEIPRDVESYTHRVGRTARAGKSGEAISFVATDEEQKFFKNILFTYQGKITLQAFDKADLPAIAITGQDGGKQRQPSNSRPRQGGGRGEKKRSAHSSGSNRSQQKGQGNRQGQGNRRNEHHKRNEHSKRNPQSQQRPDRPDGESENSKDSWRKKWRKFMGM